MPDLQEPKLPPYQPNVGQIALSAFATMAAINQRKAALQQNLMELDLRNRQMEQKQIMDEKNYLLDVRQLAETTRYHSAEIDNQSKIQQRLTDAAIEKKKADNVQAARLMGLTQRLAEIRGNTKLGTNAAERAIINAQLEFSDVWSDTDAKRVWGPVVAQHSSAAGTLVQALSKTQAKENADFQQTVKSLGTGFDTNWFQNPSVWRRSSQKVGNEYNMFVATDENGEIIPLDEKGNTPKGKTAKHFYSLPESKFKGALQRAEKTSLPDDDDAPAMSALPTGMRPGTQLSQTDQTALNWARSNPDDPRAIAIFKKLGTQ